ncbi:MAG TPA: aspartate aminotransferase family protein, partial [Actinomycetota bacterium]|nr:aspartate aminotransferase family protein [Actinomycetota bacterium]
MPDDDQTRRLLERTLHHALDYLDGMPERPIPAAQTTEELEQAFGGPLPAEPSDPLEVIDELVSAADPGLAALASPRFFGFVVG